MVTHLQVLDERNLFTGANFLIFVLSAVPNIVLVLMLPAALLLWHAARRRPQGRLQRLAQWWRAPWRLVLLGIVFAVLLT